MHFILDFWASNFPKDLQRCYQNEPSGTSACYRSGDFEMTKQVLSDDYGYCEITFKRRRGILVSSLCSAVGDSQFGQYSISGNAPAENEFSQTFEIEVVPFRGLPAPSAPTLPVLESLAHQDVMRLQTLLTVQQVWHQI